MKMSENKKNAVANSLYFNAVRPTILRWELTSSSWLLVMEIMPSLSAVQTAELGVAFSVACFSTAPTGVVTKIARKGLGNGYP